MLMGAIWCACATIEVNPLEACQSWVYMYMLGTSRRTRGRLTTAWRVIRSAAHKACAGKLQEGRRSYNDVRVDFIEGRNTFNNAILIKLMYTSSRMCTCA